MKCGFGFAEEFVEPERAAVTRGTLACPACPIAPHAAVTFLPQHCPFASVRALISNYSEMMSS